MKIAAIGVLPLMIGACAAPEESARNDPGASAAADRSATGGDISASSEPEQQIAVVETYRMRENVAGGPEPTYRAARSSGVLTVRNGCVAMRREDGSEPILVFPEGSVAVQGNGLSAFGSNFPLGTTVEVGGSAQAAPELEYRPLPVCPSGGRWFVAPGSLARTADE